MVRKGEGEKLALKKRYANPSTSISIPSIVFHAFLLWVSHFSLGSFVYVSALKIGGKGKGGRGWKCEKWPSFRQQCAEFSQPSFPFSLSLSLNISVILFHHSPKHNRTRVDTGATHEHGSSEEKRTKRRTSAASELRRSIRVRVCSTARKRKERCSETDRVWLIDTPAEGESALESVVGGDRKK
jgi:hypothetical protein